ncbi:hypothetical protein QAD02_009216 [Eretmocerus hayati]|uniref:Uncharacterized protein n=1 Tax=Eretmocerus hayati TaxID=131215 RepID=A0ACC2N8W3_9HYME|nr:hypothetical protein QAD02_009216 [Eretmocerus hayati]
MKDSMKEVPRSESSVMLIAQDLKGNSNIVDQTTAIVRRKSQMEGIRIENQTKIFASMCPDEILDYYDNYDTRSYHTTLMLGDVSGFTEMTDKYTKSGKGGPSKLTETLNSYIGAMVQEILSHNGDVLKFSGDAFIVMWKIEDGRVMRDIAGEAIKTACVIQKHFGTYETEIDITLKVKLAIASGKIYFTSIGDPSVASHYIITGKPVWEVKFAENLCRGGDILVAPSAWQWVNPNEYIYETLPDGIHTLIISLSVMWEGAKVSFSDDKISNGSSTSEYLSQDMSDTGTDNTDEASEKSLLTFQRKTSENSIDYSLRPKVIRAAKDKLKDQIRSYMLRPVIRSVDLDEPLEYLTEIRQVVIVFVNVVTEDTNRKTLIKLVKAAYSFVCSVVADMQGCVNKTSLFDKDLMFLCIFGLRGDKHELESQIGLRCASKLRRGLVKFNNVRTVSVGVTTGMTYCGVVGHVLRREYTVIGMAVNKAARLMCAYEDKVVCDRDSFLLSHLEAKHFILQEEKFLKGITSAGPVYEFSEQIDTTDHVLSLNKYPLLGRDAELRIFYDMFWSLLNKDSKGRPDESENKSNVLILRGEPRIGKTRLLEEYTHITPEDVPVNFISLAPIDKQLPYVLLRLIFDAPLEISGRSSAKQKQKKLASFFQEEDLKYLCVFNHIFNVFFKVPPEYEKLKSRARKKLLKKMLAQMTAKCFTELWVVIIDDAELADDESLILFRTIADQKKSFFVMGYGNKLSKNYPIPQDIAETAQVIDLSGLVDTFHAALACQVLNIVGIPVELERIIQERSSGNPGWIESYLISLMQSEGIVLKNLTRLQIHNMGLVTPPEHYLKRLTNELVFEDEKNSSEESMWHLFESSFRESLAGSDEFLLDDSTTYDVCTLTSRFHLEDVDAEATMDAILLKLYDSLTPLDQFLIKCAAVLGEIVDRKMLESLLHVFSRREIGECIVKLFELRIIGCAVGDFSRSPGPATLFKKMHNPTSNIPIRCGCKGIEIPADLSDLPAYAACGLMRFKLEMFRETTYRLLTENQKVEFHSKALRYMQQKTRRCTACGGGQFNKLLGETAASQADTNKKRFVADPRLVVDLHQQSEQDIFLASCELQIFDAGRASRPDDDSLMEELGRARRSSTSSSHSILSWLASCRPIAKSPTRTFSDVDFTNCECNLILLTAYTHVMAHCRGIGIKELLLVAILEFVEVLISTYNIPQATKLLAEGDDLVDAIYNSPEDALIVLPCLKGKIQTLMGKCYLESGLLTEAMNCFENTLKIMKYKFPTNPIMIRMKAYVLLKKQSWMLTWMRNFKVGIIEGDEASYNDQFASCLAEMFIIYRIKGMQEHARLAAIWGLNVALESSKDFFVLCTAFAHMMITAHNCRIRSIIPHLENEAINLCSDRQDSIELQEINAVAELYTRIFYSRWLRGLMAQATSIGYIAARLADAIKSTGLKLILLPRLSQLLISECRYNEVVSMLLTLEAISHHDMDQSGRTWYFSSCMDLLLESGIALEKLINCEQFFQRESGKIMSLRDTEAAKRFFVVMWLWYVRMGDWEAATVWRNRKCEDPQIDEYTVAASLTALKKLEGLIICYVYKVDHKNSKDAVSLLDDIKDTLKLIEDLQRVVTIVHPRYLLMKAYYHMALFRKRSALRLVRQSKQAAQKIGNLMIHTWANHCEKAWTGKLNSVQVDSWKDACTRDELLDWHEVENQSRKILPFTLPIPRAMS